MPVLVEADEVSHPRVFPVDGPCFVLGRGAESALSAIFADSKAVSRQHAQIVRVESQHYVEDLQSRNGTTLNGRRIVARQALNDGDCIGVGGKLFRFHLHSPGNAGRPSQGGPARELADEPDTSSSPLLAAVPLPSAAILDATVVSNAQRKLQAILGLLNQLGKSLDIEDVLNNLVDGLLRVFSKADEAFAGLFDDAGHLRPQTSRSRRGNDSEMRISRTLINHLTSVKSAILSAHLETDPRFEMSQSIRDANYASLMCAPLLDADGQVFGMIQLGRMGTTSRRRIFDEEDLEVLASVALQASITLRYAQAHADALHRQAVDQDLKFARRVQLAILPAEAPKIDPYRIFNYYEAAYEIGGDYYDYVPLSEGRFGIVIADAAGKGVSAALLMAKLAGEVRCCLSSQSTVAAAVAQLNDSLCESDISGRFVTLLAAVLDPLRHEVTLVNAGHPPPLLRMPDRTVRPVVQGKRSAALGLFPGQEYEEGAVPLPPGGSIIMYTDGFSEAANDRDELYGQERLTKQAASAPDDPAGLGKAIVDDVFRFVAGRRQSDDMCLLCFGRQH